MTWLDDFATRAHACLSERVLEALSERGVTEAQARQYQVGHVAGSLPDDIDFSVPFRAWCLGGRKLPDAYVFPMTNTIGQVKGFQFRSVDRGRKDYRDYIEDHTEIALFGLAQAAPFMWENRSAFLVEGTFDIFPIQRAFAGVIPTMTAGATEPLVRVLRRLVKDVWTGYDMDTPGRRACVEFSKTYGRDFTCHPVVYPKALLRNGRAAKDPSDLWEAWGSTEVERFIQTLVGS